MSYSHLRRKALGDNTIAFFLKSLIPFKSTLKRLLFKSKHVSDTNNTIGMKDLHNLRAILGHKNGIIERRLLNYVDDDVSKDFLNYLYDCLELKVDPETLDKIKRDADMPLSQSADHVGGREESLK